ncbi:hypothetical protein AOLI_G00238060 [Acnodon oligacanthus]
MMRAALPQARHSLLTELELKLQIISPRQRQINTEGKRRVTHATINKFELTSQRSAGRGEEGSGKARLLPGSGAQDRNSIIAVLEPENTRQLFKTHHRNRYEPSNPVSAVHNRTRVDKTSEELPGEASLTAGAEFMSRSPKSAVFISRAQPSNRALPSLSGARRSVKIPLLRQGERGSRASESSVRARAAASIWRSR